MLAEGKIKETARYLIGELWSKDEFTEEEIETILRVNCSPSSRYYRRIEQSIGNNIQNVNKSNKTYKRMNLTAEQESARRAKKRKCSNIDSQQSQLDQGLTNVYQHNQILSQLINQSVQQVVQQTLQRNPYVVGQGVEESFANSQNSFYLNQPNLITDFLLSSAPNVPNTTPTTPNIDPVLSNSATSHPVVQGTPSLANNITLTPTFSRNNSFCLDNNNS